MDDKKPKIDLKEAEVILQQAKAHLDRGQSLKAMQVAKKADKTVDRTVDNFKDAISSVENARRVIDEARRSGAPVGDAEELLQKANMALLSGSYAEVHELTRKSYTSIQKASFLPGRDLTVETKVEYNQGKTTLAIKVENNTDFSIRNLKVAPDLNNTPFLQETEKNVHLKPHKEEKVVYELTSTVIPGTDIKEGLVIGRDVTVETSLRALTTENKIIYVVWVTNNTSAAITGIRITPALPDAFLPDTSEKIIDQILPSEKKQLVFELSMKR
jgi:hypothetical protein